MIGGFLILYVMSEETIRKITNININDYVYPKLYVTQGVSIEGDKDHHIMAHTALRQFHEGKWYLTHKIYRITIAEKYVTRDSLVYAALQTIGESAYRDLILSPIVPGDTNCTLDESQINEKTRLQLTIEAANKTIAEAKPAK